jgi:hypothetical protein
MKKAFGGKYHTRLKALKYYIKMYRTLIIWGAVWKMLYTELFQQNSPESDIFHLAPAVTHKSFTLFLLLCSYIEFLSVIVALWNIGTKKKLKLYIAIVKNTSNSKGFTCLAQAFLVALRRITTMSEPESSKHGEGMCQIVQTTLFYR